jgi:hypothetical protein
LLPQVGGAEARQGHSQTAELSSADQAVEADSFFSDFDRQSAVDFRRNSDDEFSAV